MAGYIRQDIANEIDNGQVIKAPPLDAEFNALVAAFSAASGHRHNGTSGEGAPITVLGPSQNVGISTNSITPSVDNVIDLGSTTLEFKDIWIDGVANIDLLTADAGTVAGAAITTISNTQTLTGKTINLTDNTLIATSAQMAAAVTDETGTGALVFAGSPALTGTPTAPTAAAATNTTQLATTAHVFAERSNTASLTNKTIDATNNTLILTSAQLAAALTDETGTGASVFAGSPAFTGTPTAPTAVAGTNTTQLATTAHVFAERSNTATLTNKTISGGSISGITDLAVADGGTGASDAATARTNLGLVIGTNVQAQDATLTSIAALGTVADRMVYTTGVDTWAETPSTAFGRSLMDDADATAGRATLALGTMATQNAATVAITGGSVTGITDITVADGGTGSSTAAGARTNLGLVIGTDVQAQDAELAAIAGLTSAADTVPYFTGSGTASLSSFTAAGRALVDDVDATAQRTTLGLPALFNAKANRFQDSAIMIAAAPGDQAVFTQIGMSITGNGTTNTPAWNASTIWGRVRKIATASVTSATAIVGVFSTGSRLTVGGPSTGLGGFNYDLIWGPNLNLSNATHRAFAGLRAHAGTVGTDVNPSTLLDSVGMGWDDADTNVQIIHNDGSGVATKIDLGASFPVPTVDSATLYRVQLSSPSGTTQSVDYTITNIVTAATTSGTITTNLPSTTTGIGFMVQMSVGGTNTSVGLVFSQVVIETAL